MADNFAINQLANRDYLYLNKQTPQQYQLPSVANFKIVKDKKICNNLFLLIDIKINQSAQKIKYILQKPIMQENMHITVMLHVYLHQKFYVVLIFFTGVAVQSRKQHAK